MDISQRLDQGTKNLRYWFVITVIALGGFLAGYDTTIIGSALIFITPYFKLNSSLVGLTVAIESLFMVFGAIFSGPIIDRVGRKPLLLVDAAIYAVFAIMSALVVSSIELIIMRALVGIAVGQDYAIAPSYLSELSRTKVRGRSNMLEQLMYFAGAIISFWVGYALSFTANWRLMFGVGLIPAIILLATRVYLPESPRWLMNKGDVKKAAKSLEFFGSSSANLENVATDDTKLKKISLKTLFADKAYKRAFIIIAIFMMFVPSTGINVILSYGPTIYTYLGLTGSKAILQTGIAETAGIAEFALSFYLIDKVGRRPLGVYSYLGEAIAIALSIVGIIYLNHNLLAQAVLFIFISMNLFLLFFHVGPGSILWTVSGEVFPTHIRGGVVGIFMAIDTFTNFVILLIFPIWKSAFGLFTWYEFELGMAVAAFFFTLLFLRETKNVPLESVKDKYGGKWVYFRREKED
jgi:sugar porter (SP) family MFS transporter